MFLLTTPFRGVWSNCLITSDAWTSLLASTVWGLVAESVASYALTTPGGDETLLDGNCCDGRAAAAAVGVVECSGGLDNSVTLFLVLLVAMAAISRWREIHSRKGLVCVCVCVCVRVCVHKGMHYQGMGWMKVMMIQHV